jgi:16S rRNA (guanine966-N2)-methyltransferase
MDRVREALFSSLGEWILDAAVLDLFSGSGSVGIEALSRGAGSVDFVERQRDCADAIRKNLQKTGLTAAIHNQDVFDFIEKQREQNPAYDLIFADPPYKKSPTQNDDAGALVLSSLLPALLAEEGMFVLETGERWQLPGQSLWELKKEKRYGGTKLWYFKKAREGGRDSGFECSAEAHCFSS